MGDPVEQWLEDCLTLPGKLHRALRLMAHLEQEASRIETQFRSREKEFLLRLRQSQQQGTAWPAAEQEEEIVAIKFLHAKCRALLREKVAVNKQIASFIHYEQQRLVKERDKLLHSMHGLGAAATLKAHGVAGQELGAVTAAGPGGVPGGHLPGVGAPSAVGGTPGAGPLGATGTHGGTGSAGGSTVGRSALRRRAAERGGSSILGTAGDVSSGLPGDGAGADRGGGAGLGLDADGSGFYVRGADRTALNGDYQAHQDQGASASRHPSSQSSTVTAGPQGAGGPPHAASGADARGQAGLAVPAAPAGVHHPSGSKSSGGGRSRNQPSHGSRSRHDGSGSKGGAAAGPLASSGSASPAPSYGSGHRMGASPGAYYPPGGGSADPAGHAGGGASSGSGAGVPGGAGATTRSGGQSESADAWEGICPVCHKGESSECNNMVACDACNQWFHFECVGYSAETQEDDAWFCPQCYQHGLVP
ncbi:PHD-finger domain-containing protein [Besnoitia besnoiti]|uniref:Inhibitor of growth protein n=1 Tax=Besnoitia besnoiti TaxID=94643 RepID=A0A2A9M7Y7_BESBE|nr:PHD-finger domain-containing protein [Besnoitia besnoiti]PFH31783.1 PHD-finger domain-containing protein [Besnoitia besnoiti]